MASAAAVCSSADSWLERGAGHVLLCRPTGCQGVPLGAQGRLSSPTSEDALLASRSRLQSTSFKSCIGKASAAAVACSGPVPLPSPFASQQEQVHRLVWHSAPSHPEGHFKQRVCPSMPVHCRARHLIDDHVIFKLWSEGEFLWGAGDRPCIWKGLKRNRAVPVCL